MQSTSADEQNQNTKLRNPCTLLAQVYFCVRDILGSGAKRKKHQ